MNGESGPKDAIRILHVVDGLERGGITGWLVSILRNLRCDEFRMDFLVHTDRACAYDAEASNLGARVIRCPDYRRPWSYSRRFLSIVKQYGPYDIVHSHCHRFSGFIFLLAHRARIPVRIAQGHTSSSGFPSRRGPARRGYYWLMDRWIDRYCTTGLAVSPGAARDLFGPAWESRGLCRLLHSGIDTEPFHRPFDRAAVRSELGLSPGALVVGHVGRFTPPKNHIFLLEVFAAALRMEPKLRLVLIGDGAEEDSVRRKAKELALDDSVVFLGSRPDVPRLLLGAIDLFLFPSLSEGLGLAFLEAQAAGLPCIVSANVPEETDVVRPLITRLSLDLPAQDWAEQLIRAGTAPPVIPREDALKKIEDSPFTISSSLRALQEVYRMVKIPQKGPLGESTASH